MAELISQELNNRLNNLVTGAFFLNRVLDRSMSLLSVKFKMLNSARILHPTIAHHFPQAADVVLEMQDSRGMLTIYGDTPKADFDYNNHIEMFEMLFEEFIKYQDMIEDTIDFSISEKDHMIRAFLDKYLLDLNPYIATMSNIVELSKQYGLEPVGVQLFDENIETCLAVPNLDNG